MKIERTPLEGVVIVEPAAFEDERGWFREIFSARAFAEKVFVGEAQTRFGGFVQENESFSRYGVIRGLHYQLPPAAQGKLVRVVSGTVLDVAVDIRRGSPGFGKHVAVELSDRNKKMLWVPRGFAHGFAVLSDTAKVVYLCDAAYDPVCDRSVFYGDRALGIDWRVPETEMTVSQKDSKASLLCDAELFDYNDTLY